MSRKILIGLAGPARSGKSTAATYIEQQFGFAQYAFAQPLKEALRGMLNLSDRELEGDLKEEALTDIGLSPRQLMQTLGTEWGRQHGGRDFWLRVAERRLAHIEDALPHAFNGYVISDVRFENEAAWVRARGGVILHIHRPDAPQVASHSSEHGIAIHGGDIEISNDADIETLHAVLRAIIGGIICRQLRKAA